MLDGASYLDRVDDGDVVSSRELRRASAAAASLKTPARVDDETGAGSAALAELLVGVVDAGFAFDSSSVSDSSSELDSSSDDSDSSFFTAPGWVFDWRNRL